MTNEQKELAAVLALLPCSLEYAYKCIRYVMRKGLIFQLQSRQRAIYFKLIASNNLSKEANAVLAFLESAVRTKEEHENHVDASADNVVLQRIKDQKKMNWLKDHRSILVELRNKGYSFRQIEKIISTRFRLSISHTYLASFVKNYGGSSCSKKS